VCGRETIGNELTVLLVLQKNSDIWKMSRYLTYVHVMLNLKINDKNLKRLIPDLADVDLLSLDWSNSFQDL
jgi:hypothetical protein